MNIITGSGRKRKEYEYTSIREFIEKYGITPYQVLRRVEQKQRESKHREAKI